MIHIERLVSERLPELVRGREISLVSLRTTNPVYLVFFGNSARYPDLVLSLSRSPDATETFRIQETLHHLNPALFPEPIYSGEMSGQFVVIQRGLKGCPWFQLATRYAGRNQWQGLCERAVKTLTEFQRTVCLKQEWQQVCEPGSELRSRYQELNAASLSLPKNLNHITEHLSLRLGQLGRTESYPQHGDFSLNNLIIDESGIKVIDFEDFAMTNMPLHDNFTLALSLYQFAPASAQRPLKEYVALCVNHEKTELANDAEIRAGLFLHHILLRLGDWSATGNREDFRNKLLHLLGDFCRDYTVLV